VNVRGRFVCCPSNPSSPFWNYRLLLCRIFLSSIGDGRHVYAPPREKGPTYLPFCLSSGPFGSPFMYVTVSKPPMGIACHCPPSPPSSCIVLWRNEHGSSRLASPFFPISPRYKSIVEGRPQCSTQVSRHVQPPHLLHFLSIFFFRFSGQGNFFHRFDLPDGLILVHPTGPFPQVYAEVRICDQLPGTISRTPTS